MSDDKMMFLQAMDNLALQVSNMEPFLHFFSNLRVES